MARSRAIVAAVALRLEFTRRCNRVAAIAEITEIGAVLGAWQPGTARQVHFVVAIGLGAVVHIIAHVSSPS